MTTGRSAGRLLVAALIVSVTTSGWSQTRSPVLPTTTARIVNEGLSHGLVMADAEWLSDHIGARLTNSPGMRKAEAWALARFGSLGLSNVRRQGFDFGRGWSFQTIHVDMVTPRSLQLHAIPLAWTPATVDTVTAPVAFAPMAGEADFAAWRGKLAGKWVLVDEPALKGPAPREVPLRLYPDDLGKFEGYLPLAKRGARPGWLGHCGQGRPD